MTAIPETVTTAMLAAARGTYQRALLTGQETWSGSSLRGKAGRYSGRYARSRWSLVERIKASLVGSGWTVESKLVLRDSRWRRCLVAVSPAGEQVVVTSCP